jgi:transposase
MLVMRTDKSFIIRNKENGMQIKSILNSIEKQQGFVYDSARWCMHAGQRAIEIAIHPRKGSRPACSGCGKRCPGYDTLPTRRFEFVPLWNIKVFFVHAPRRCNCPRCGIKVERLPWAKGKSHLTTSYAWFLAGWAKRLTWTDTAKAFHASWDTVVRAVRMAVDWGLANRDLHSISAIGIDEIAWKKKKGVKFVTVVYQIDKGSKRLLWMGKERTIKTLNRFFDWLGKDRSHRLRFVVSDMWRPYLKVIAERATQAVNVLDRFHVAAHMSKAIDKIRADETKRLKEQGEEPVLTHSRWCLLKRPANLTDRQVSKLTDLLRCNLKTVRAYILKEDFQRFWEYVIPGWAGRFLDDWCTRTMRSRLKPMKKVAKMLRNHRELLLNWFRANGEIALGSVEGFNNKAKVVTKRAYGFRSYNLLELALYHSLGDLPTPNFTHKFC